MSLNTNIPQPLQSLGQTWLPIQQNFNNIETGFVVNHVDWNSGTDTGKHTYVTMPAQTTLPTTASYEQTIFCKNDTNSKPQLWVASANAGPMYNFTGAYTFPSGPWALGSKGTTTLPSGLIIKWGFNSVNAGTGTISFIGTVGAFTNNLFAVYITPSVVTNAVMSVGTLSVNDFVVNCSQSATTSFYWFAIGN